MKGIVCIPEMARAVCADRKTVTRRVMVPQPTEGTERIEFHAPAGEWQAKRADADITGLTLTVGRWRPEYVAGERRCLLTTWAVSSEWDETKPTEISRHIELFWHAGLGTKKPDWAGKSRAGRFLSNDLRPLMPVFEIASVGAERVQDIDGPDALAEGVETLSGLPTINAVTDFATLWDSINLKRGFGWAINPWVWRVEFRRIKP